MKNYVFRFWDRFLNNPVNAVIFVIIFTIAAWTVQCSMLQSVLGLDILEALSWGAHGDTWGNTKHPPLSGWIAHGLSTIAGCRDWIMYLAAQLCLAVGIWFTYLTAKLFLDRYEAAAGAILLVSCYHYCPSLLKFSTFFVEIAMMPVIAYSFFTAMRKKNIFSYAILGLACGIAFLNKYSIGLLFAALTILFFSTKEYRAELKSLRPYLAGIIFIAVIYPHIVWLTKNNFICLNHVGNRLHEEYKWYEPIVVFLTAVYPAAVALGVLAAAALPLRKSLVKRGILFDTFKWSCLFTAVPALILFISSLSGNSVIMMWFCTLASFTGILAVSVFPFKIDRLMFRNIFLLITIYMTGFFIASTIDVAVKSRPRIHMDTAKVIAFADAEWQKKHPGKPIKFVVGDRWYGNIISHYHKDKPAILEMDKELKNDWKRRNYLQKALNDGALVIGRKKELFQDFADELQKTTGQKIDFTRKYACPYKAILGKEKTRDIFIDVITANSEVKIK